MKNAIVILGYNIDYLKALTDNLPELDCDFIICYESRIANNINDLVSLLPNTKIIDSKNVIAEFMKLQDTEFLHTYTMSMNILLQWYVFKFMNYDKVIFTDDDVILTKDINKIFDKDECMLHHTEGGALYTSYPNVKPISKIYMDDMFKIFDINFEDDPDIIKKSHIWSGQRYYVRGKFDIDYYEDKLLKFFNSEVMPYIWSKRTRNITFHIDEIFEGLFAYCTDIINSEFKHYCKIEFCGPHKFDLDKYNKIEKSNGLWHYAAGQYKPDWIRELRKHNKIK